MSLMRKLPDCPKCQEDELWLHRWGYWFEVKCYLCGWRSGDVTMEVGVDIDDAIAAIVKAAQEPVGDAA